MEHYTVKRKPNSLARNYSVLTVAQKRQAKTRHESIAPKSGLKFLKTFNNKSDVMNKAKYIKRHIESHWMIYHILNHDDPTQKPVVTETLPRSGYSSSITMRYDDLDLMSEGYTPDIYAHKQHAIETLQRSIIACKIRSSIKPFKA